MRTVSLSTLGRILTSALDRVVHDREPMLVTREGGKSPVVILSLEDFASYEETEFLLKSPRNAGRLKAAVKNLASDR
ncbi:MAG: type II toxin-antitoxin system Phd/YefM family antitoxin [Hyphomicrobiales bacterium]